MSTPAIVSFSIPLVPPSVNHYLIKKIWKRRDGTVFIAPRESPEAVAFKDAVVLLARGMSVSPDSVFERKRVRYRVTIDVYLGKRQRGDADNFNKVCLDALQEAGCIHSDANVSTCITSVHKDQRDNPRTLFIIERITNE